MTDNDDGPFTLAFVGYTGPEPGAAERASAYEDAILPLLADHGAELVFRGRRSGGQDPELPVEFQLLRFPSRRALASYLKDERREAAIREFGEVFATTHVVEVDEVVKLGDGAARSAPASGSATESTESPPASASAAPSPPAVVSAVMPGDDRATPPLVGDEREILCAYLDWQRRTVELKCAGVPPERLSEKVVPPSGLSLHGLLRHLAGVERWWFRIQFAGEQIPHLYYSDDDPNQDFDDLEGDPAEALAVWREECERSRAIVAATPSLDATGTHAMTGEPVSLRRVLVHLIAEYARHNGHADLLRERIDNTTGL
ncbi:MAG TPA: DinB family protein [Acidimicrobiales bacterium]